MSKQRRSSGSTTRSGSTSRRASRSKLGQQISQLDRKILQLVQQRAGLIQSAAEQAASAEEAASLGGNWTSIVNDSPNPLGERALRAIFREVDSACQSLVCTTRVAYLGPEFSYSHLAAIERYGQSSQLLPVATISSVFEAVHRGDVQFGIVPIENSTDGRIVDTLEMFTRSPVCICGEVQMRIHHCLLGSCALPEVREVHSKPQALSQCRQWLSTQLPNIRTVATTSTTAAAENATSQKGVAAIASRQAGVNYGLSVLAASIEDNPDNVTRFAVIGLEPSERTGRDKTSLLFELAHQPGALADVMAVFKRQRLNLTWIESFPKKGSQNEYLFFVEFEGHPKDLVVRKAIRSLERKTVSIRILGSYARMRPAGG
jgi:chorismate mutase/prephenate dehydratase